MQITSALFDAYLKCPTKCFLKALGETEENSYGAWVKTRDAAYRNEATTRIADTSSSQ